MTRINLLPPEILEKRKSEQRWVWVVFGAVGVFALVGVAWTFFHIQVISKEAERSSRQQEAANLRSQAERFKIFEDKQKDLVARQAVAEQALADRVNWSKLFTELSLVLPSDVWLDQLTADQKTGLVLNGWALAPEDEDAPESGHKAVAKVLVRLNDLDQLGDVWLSSSEKREYLEQMAIKFTITSTVSESGTAAPRTATAVPGPPAGD